MTTSAMFSAVNRAELFRRTGTVLESAGDSVTARGINLKPNELAVVETMDQPLIGQCAGMQDGVATLALLDRGPVAAGARVIAVGTAATAPAGRGVLGRIIDGLGRPLDGGPEPWRPCHVPIHAEPPKALTRSMIADPLPTGVRAIDGLLTLARGQRVGIFSGSGVGKSTLLGMLARGAETDVVVVGLIGERGREVREFIERDAGPDALKRSTVVVATGDATPAMRLNAARSATAIAEHHRDEGRSVLLLFDSLTRVAMAQREIGLASGEPPATRGYPPSVFSILPHLMERTGPGKRGSITAVYTVLADSDEIDDPVSEIARATLDGHIVLRRSLAGAGHYPPIDVLHSASRLMSRVVSKRHDAAAQAVRGMLAAYEDARDLISIGAYVEGADPAVDQAVALMPAINDFLRQGEREAQQFDEIVAQLVSLAPGLVDDKEDTATDMDESAAGDTDAEEVTSDDTLEGEADEAGEAA